MPDLIYNSPSQLSPFISLTSLIIESVLLEMIFRGDEGTGDWEKEEVPDVF